MPDDTEVRFGRVTILTGDLEIVFNNDLESMAAHMTLLREAIKRMQSVVCKLPKTADGISIVPGTVFFLIDDQDDQAKPTIRTIVITSLRNMKAHPNITAHARIDGAELALPLSDVFSSRKAADDTLAARALIKAEVAEAEVAEAEIAKADVAEAEVAEVRQAQAQADVLDVPQAGIADAQADTAELRRDWLERSNRSRQRKLWKHQAAQQKRRTEIEAAIEAWEREASSKAESQAKWRNEQ